MRIVIVGTSGSGKTTLARQISQALNIPHVELDALYWEPGWVESSLPVFRERLVNALECDDWVVDGNYSKVRDILWSRAEIVLWLDYALPFVLRRLVKRTFSRVFKREILWGTNRETLSKTLFSRDSIILWAITSHKRNRLKYLNISQSFEYKHLKFHRFRSPVEATLWLATLSSL